MRRPNKISFRPEAEKFRVVQSDGNLYLEEKGDGKAVVILPYVGDSLVLVETDRAPFGRSFLEAPRGYVDPTEDIVDAAIRELRDQTGYIAKPYNIKFLGTSRAHSSIIKSEVQIVIAELGPNAKPGTPMPDIGVKRSVLVPKRAAANMIQFGELTDGLTMAALALHWSDVMRHEKRTQKVPFQAETRRWMLA